MKKKLFGSEGEIQKNNNFAVKVLNSFKKGKVKLLTHIEKRKTGFNPFREEIIK